MRSRAMVSALLGCVAALLVFGCHKKQAAPVEADASSVTEFDSAVRDGDTDIVSRLITAKPEMVNAPDETGKTPLKIATEKGDTDMANLLRRHGGHE